MITTYSFLLSFDSESLLTSYFSCFTFHLVLSQLYRSHFTIKSVLTPLGFNRLRGENRFDFVLLVSA